MTHFRISEAAALLGVSDDTLRRWVEQGRLTVESSVRGPRTVAGTELAALAQSIADEPDLGALSPASARNRMTGIVTRVVKDGVMAQVEMQAGRSRIVSLMSRDAADELGLEVGTLAVASVKSTHVVVELPGHGRPSA